MIDLRRRRGEREILAPCGAGEHDDEEGERHQGAGDERGKAGTVGSTNGDVAK